VVGVTDRHHQPRVAVRRGPGMGDNRSQFPIARLRYSTFRDERSLHWCDRNLKFHVHDLTEPSPDPQDLLDEIDSNSTAVFWLRRSPANGWVCGAPKNAALAIPLWHVDGTNRFRAGSSS
jgi:hypothetical protein